MLENVVLQEKYAHGSHPSGSGPLRGAVALGAARGHHSRPRNRRPEPEQGDPMALRMAPRNDTALPRSLGQRHRAPPGQCPAGGSRGWRRDTRVARRGALALRPAREGSRGGPVTLGSPEASRPWSPLPGEKDSRRANFSTARWSRSFGFVPRRPSPPRGKHKMQQSSTNWGQQVDGLGVQMGPQQDVLGHTRQAPDYAFVDPPLSRLQRGTFSTDDVCWLTLIVHGTP